MSTKQVEQFNRMRAALKRIANDYQRAEQILRGGGEFGLDSTETLEAAYDNIQSEAAAAVRNVRAIQLEP